MSTTSAPRTGAESGGRGRIRTCVGVSPTGETPALVDRFEYPSQLCHSTFVARTTLHREPAEIPPSNAKYSGSTTVGHHLSLYSSWLRAG